MSRSTHGRKIHYLGYFLALARVHQLPGGFGYRFVKRLRLRLGNYPYQMKHRMVPGT